MLHGHEHVLYETTSLHTYHVQCKSPPLAHRQSPPAGRRLAAGRGQREYYSAQWLAGSTPPTMSTLYIVHVCHCIFHPVQSTSFHGTTFKLCLHVCYSCYHLDCCQVLYGKQGPRVDQLDSTKMCIHRVHVQVHVYGL